MGKADRWWRPTDNMAAYTLYLRGQFAWNKRTPEGYRDAIAEFERAAGLDPGFALPHAGIAYCHAMLGMDDIGVAPPLEALPKAQAAAERALALDPLLPQAHGARGVVAFLYDWNWALAERGGPTRHSAGEATHSPYWTSCVRRLPTGTCPRPIGPRCCRGWGESTRRSRFTIAPTSSGPVGWCSSGRPAVGRVAPGPKVPRTPKEDAAGLLSAVRIANGPPSTALRLPGRTDRPRARG